MPELPDLLCYKEALEERIVGHPLRSIRLLSPFLLRSVDPPVEVFEDKIVHAIRLLGKRTIWEFPDDHFLVFHLMISGRFHLKKAGTIPNRKTGLAAFGFDDLSLHLTEASSRKRASLHACIGWKCVRDLDRGGIGVLETTPETFTGRLRSERHTLKRALTDPRLFAGIGNAYSDEILHHAKLSPLQLTTNLSDEECEQLHASVRTVLTGWTERLRQQRATGFPEKVTAFHPEMAVHGKFREPCPVCRTPVQRIVYAENECNYCPACQTNGRILADRSLSRLLKDDWPKRVEDLEDR